jgi:predicted dehydrogenase
MPFPATILFVAPHMRISEHPERYGLSGSGLSWSHTTMNSREAREALERFSNNLKSAMSIVSTQVRKKGRDKRPDETYFSEDRAFIDALRNEGEPRVSGEDGLRVLEVLEAIKESIEGERLVKVERAEILLIWLF